MMTNTTQATITLYIDPDTYKNETERELTNEQIREYGRQANDDAAGMYGYSGWETAMPPTSRIPSVTNVCDRRNREDRTNGYNAWHVLELPVQAHDLDHASGLPDEDALDAAIRGKFTIDELTRDDMQTLAALIGVKLDYLHEREFPAYDELMERIAKRYQARCEAILNNIGKICRDAGYVTDPEPFDMTGDEYKWSLRVWYGPERADDQCVDVSVEITEARAYGDDEVSHGYGLNFGIDLVEFGGQIVGQFQPFNYTPSVWVDARDKDEVEARFKLIEESDIGTIPDLLRGQHDLRNQQGRRTALDS